MNFSRSGPVVVGYDGSPDADRALAWGGATATALQRDLRVVVAEPELRPTFAGVRDWERQLTREALARANEQVAAGGFAQADVIAGSGQPAAVLIEETRHACLLAVGSRGHNLVAGTLLGSVSMHLSHHAECPVVVVRPAHRSDSRTILVGVDGSTGSAQALEFGFELAASTGKDIVALFGWPLGERPWSELYGPTDPAVAARADAATSMVTEFVAGFSSRWPDIAVRAEAVPVPPERLLVDASSEASLLVVGSRGHGAFAGMLLGSLGQRVLHQAHCPVAVVR
jgi:nucleotide-binding universal stress UspA family protein